MIEFADAKKVAGMLAAVGEPTRMRILYRLALGPHHVGQLAELLDVPMVNMSHHLGVLRQAGLLDDEKQGRRVIYKVRPDVVAAGAGNGDLAVLTLGHLRLTIKADGEAPAASRPRRKSAGAKPAPKAARAAKGSAPAAD